METQKIINLNHKRDMIQVMKSQKLLQESGMSQKVKQQKVNTNKAILLNLKQKLLNQVFLIILMHLF